MRNNRVLAVLAVAACAGLWGCENTAQGVKQDAKENAAAAREEAPDAKAKAAEAGDDVKDAANKAGNAVAGAVKDTAPTVDAAKQTLDVKTALLADKSIDASKIDVDTDAATRTVTLKGSVPTAAQKTAAEHVAHAKAEGYKVRNLLTVSR